ncbi:MAG: phosphatidate cytidylyltransferase, partial [Bdellovibrionia bacterium]
MMSPELKRRVLTGVIGGSGLLALILWGGWVGTFLFASSVSLGMAYELSEMTLHLPDKVEKRSVFLAMIWLIHWVNVWTRAEFVLLIVFFLTLFAYFLLTASRHREEELGSHLRELMAVCFGLIYTGFIPLYFSRIYEAPHGTQWVLMSLLIVFAGDTGAYFVGMKYGKNKLYPQISPKKTQEGAVGGVLSGFFVSVGMKLLFLKSLPWAGVLIIPWIVGPVAQIGDLCESFLKRAFKTKDSGSLLPGHGGLLDRFDGVV